MISCYSILTYAMNTTVCSQNIYLLHLAYWSSLWGTLEWMPCYREGTWCAVTFRDLAVLTVDPVLPLRSLEPVPLF